MAIPSTIFVVGAQGSGKSTFARMLSDALEQLPEPSCLGHWPVSECSTILARRLAHLLQPCFPLPGVDEQQLAERIVRNKDYFREALRRLGEQMAEDSPAQLVRMAARHGRIVVGVRRREEVLAYCAQQMEHGDSRGDRNLWVLVDRTPTGPDDFEREMFQLQICRKTIFNNGDVALLKQNAWRLAAEILESK